LVGPTRLFGARPRQSVAPMTTGVLWKKEEGNVVSVRQAHALFVVTPKKRPPRSRTRPSLGPETRARQSSLSWIQAVQAAGLQCGAAVEISRSGKPAQAGGTGTGVTIVRTHARLAAYHRFLGQLRRVGVMRKKRKVVMAIVPARKRELGLGCPYVVCAVAEVGRQHPGLE